MKTCVVTIVSANYLAYARVLRESVARHEPDFDVKVLIVDRDEHAVRDAVSDSGLQTTYASELGLADFEALAFKYDLVELNTALKPTFIKKQFATGYETVIYLDPDISLFGPLTAITKALVSSEILLIPHALAPVLDGKRPSDIDFLRNGAYNLGFVAMRQGPGTNALLDWWEDRCLSYGFNDLGFGTFVDQKWMDLAPSYFASVFVFRDPTCNVAYWNLHERTLTSDGRGNFLVSGARLTFFHFSGVKAESPGVLSRHQTRHHLVPGTVLAELVEEYCAALIRLGHERYGKLTYTFGCFSDGSRISGAHRKASLVETADGRPFAADGALRASLSRSGLFSAHAESVQASSNTLDFDESDKRVTLVNTTVRVLSRLLGTQRVEALLRYAAFLARESNYVRVILRRPFHLPHDSKR